MREAPNLLSTVVAGSGAAVFLFALVILGAVDGHAGDSDGPLRPTMPALPEVKAVLEPGDEIAALKALQTALTEAGDGATYVFRHGQGRLNGAIRMTRTFRDGDGHICRHLEMLLNSGTYTRHHEGIACRDGTGLWQLDG